MGLKIQVFRRWRLEEPLEEVLKGLHAAFEWARSQGSGVAQLRWGSYLYDRELGIVGVRVPLGEDEYFWRLAFETVHQGVVCIEVYNKAGGIFSWVRYLHYVLVHGLEYSEVKTLRLGYRKDVRVGLSEGVAAWDGESDLRLASLLVDSTVVLACEYLGLLSCHKVFSKISSPRVRVGALKSKCEGFDYWVEKLGALLYEPWSSCVGTTQPEEYSEMLDWFRLYYETVYRKVSKTIGADPERIQGVLMRFTDVCVERLRSTLHDGLFMWNNSFIPVNLNCERVPDVKVMGVEANATPEM